LSARPVVVLLLLGMGWGLSATLTKIAVSTGHRQFGLLMWQTVLGALLLGGICLARGRWPRFGRAQLLACLLVALAGSVLSGLAYYLAIIHLPVGVMVLLLSLIPMMAFPLALAAGVDAFSATRLAGLALGLLGVALIALPDASLPPGTSVLWVAVGLVAPLLYAMEGVGIARWGTAGLDPVQTLLGANLVGAALTVPLALATGQVIDPRPPWGSPEWAILGASVINALVYSTYVWLVARAGATFAAQCSYLVTGFGVLWAMALLGERYPWSVWAALAVMMGGLLLVQPRPDPKALRAGRGEA
jgi:drug/metabolite transporter (DMT)-like permease